MCLDAGAKHSSSSDSEVNFTLLFDGVFFFLSRIGELQLWQPHNMRLNVDTQQTPQSPQKRKPRDLWSSQTRKKPNEWDDRLGWTLLWKIPFTNNSVFTLNESFENIIYQFIIKKHSLLPYFKLSFSVSLV